MCFPDVSCVKFINYSANGVGMYPCRMSLSGTRSTVLCAMLCYAVFHTKQMRIIVIALVFVVLLCSRAMRVDSFVSRCKCWVNTNIFVNKQRRTLWMFGRYGRVVNVQHFQQYRWTISSIHKVTSGFSFRH